MEAYERYGPALMRKARRMLQNDADAADLVQSLFVQLWQDGRAPLDLPFLYRALTRRCLNHIRDSKNRSRLLERQAPALRGQARVQPDDQVLTMEALLMLADRVEPEVFETLVFRYFDEMGQQEIADLVGVSRKTIQKRLGVGDAAILAMRSEVES